MLPESVEKWEYARYMSRVGEYIPSSFYLYLPYANFHSDSVEDILLQVTGRPPDSNEAGFDLLINQLGSEGWEMFQINEYDNSETSTSSTKLYFKRRVK